MATEPTGGTKEFANPSTIDDCWISETTTPKLAIYNTDYSAYFDAFAIAACSFVNEYCNRFFNQQQADEVFLNRLMGSRQYEQFVLRNRPLISVDNVWEQITDTFNVVNLDLMQFEKATGIVKLIGDVSTVSTILPDLVFGSTSGNIFIRYTSGYTTVPSPVVMATAMYAETLFEIDNTSSAIESFKTQTYSEKAGSLENHPKMNLIKKLLEPYVLDNFYAK
jgi:hypothetical protein